MKKSHSRKAKGPGQSRENLTKVTLLLPCRISLNTQRMKYSPNKGMIEEVTKFKPFNCIPKILGVFGKFDLVYYFTKFRSLFKFDVQQIYSSRYS